MSKADMRSIFEESNSSNLLKDFEENHNFTVVIKDKNEAVQDVYYGAFYLNCVSDEFNIFNKTNEDIGTLVNICRKSDIKNFTPEHCLDSGGIILIPTKSSIQRLDEFASLFKNVKFPLLFLNKSNIESVEDTIVATKEFSFDEIVKLVNSDTYILDYLGVDSVFDVNVVDAFPEKQAQETIEVTEHVQEEAVQEEVVQEDNVKDEQIEQAQDEEEQIQESDEDSDDDGETPYFDNSDTPFEVADEPVDEEANQVETEQMEESQVVVKSETSKAPQEVVSGDFVTDERYDNNDDEDEDVEDDEQDDDYDEEDVGPIEMIPMREKLVEVLQGPNGFTVPIDYSDFKAKYVINNDIHYFPEDRDEKNEVEAISYINKQLNEFSKIANIELKNARRDSIKVCEEFYNKHLTMLVNEQKQQFDFKNPENDVYYKMYEEIMHAKEEFAKAEEEKLDISLRQLNENFESDKRIAIESAVKRAETEFMMKMGGRHNNEIAKRKADYETAVDKFYNEHITSLKEFIMDESSTIITDFKAECLKLVSKLWEERREYENSLIEKHTKIMTDFINVNKEDDIHRVNVLKKELTETNKAEEVRKEYIDKIESIKKEFETSLEKVKLDFDTLQRSKSMLEQAKDKDYATVVMDAQRQSEKYVDEIDRLNKRIDKIVEEKDYVYRTKVNVMNDEYDRLARAFDRYKVKQTALIAGMAVISFISMIVGIFGFLMHFKG